jgi:organic radical activating enzyme
MITQVCNLSCLGCTNYSDLPHWGYVKWSQGKSWIEPWLEILEIPDFGIMGGEPLINPEVESWMVGIRELMPDSQIRFTTNGLLLDRWPHLLDLAQDIGNCIIKITVHLENQQLEHNIQKLFSKFSWEPVIEYGIHRWKTHRNLRLQINRPQEFLKTYQNNYVDMRPYNSDPVKAFQLCVQQTCPLLLNEKIYKCSTSALLANTLEKFGRPNWQEWEPYLESGISVDSDSQLIENFVNNFGKPHKQCAQCPDSKLYAIPHLINVVKK